MIRVNGSKLRCEVTLQDLLIKPPMPKSPLKILVFPNRNTREIKEALANFPETPWAYLIQGKSIEVFDHLAHTSLNKFDLENLGIEEIEELA